MKIFLLSFLVLFFTQSFATTVEPEKASDTGGTPPVAEITADRSNWIPQGGYSMRPFVGAGFASMPFVEGSKLGAGTGLQIDVGLLNEFKFTEKIFLRLRPSLNLRGYGIQMGATDFNYYNLFLRAGIGGKINLSHRWALFLDLNPQFAMGRGYCGADSGSTGTYDDGDWDDDWDLMANPEFEADRDLICGDLSRNLNMFQLGMRGGATLRLASRILLEGFIEVENNVNSSKMVEGKSYALGVNFNFIAF